MKKIGIINGKLLGELARIGHTEEVLICDAGFPVQRNANIIDLSLIEGVPSFSQVLEAVLSEFIFESYTVLDTMKKFNFKYSELLKLYLQVQERKEMEFNDFVENASSVQLVIRTGEILPCSNVILKCASGVKIEAEKYNVL